MGGNLELLIFFLYISDICLKSNVGIADSLYNLRLVKEFCDNYIPGKAFHLTYEDFLYMHNNLRQNVEVFLAELFYWFEIQKLDCVYSEPGQWSN
mgnify:CR=1 FL=1